jgi:RNA polymerase sigma-70 factor (sigma-E family)
VRVDDAEFDEIYRAHRDSLFRLGVLICGDPARSEDAVADAFVKVLPRWRGGAVELPGPYLRRAVVNGLIGGFRRLAREERHIERRWGDSRADQGLDATVSDHESIRGALLQLPVAQRAVLVLRYYADLSEADTAQVLGISVGTVKSRASRAMVRLRELLAEDDVDIEVLDDRLLDGTALANREEADV